MSWKSVDALQKALTSDVFHYAKDAKKAAGRALGTLVEIITFYLLKGWGCDRHIAIERRLPEYANSDITHNVEFSLHPCRNTWSLSFPKGSLPLTAKKLAKQLEPSGWAPKDCKSRQLLSSGLVLRNACTLYEDDASVFIAVLMETTPTALHVAVNQLRPHPFAVVECKRVGVEEGVKKGPQAIEKAKQGAYVARTVSSLQKIRMRDGSIHGVLQLGDGSLKSEPYEQFLQSLITSTDSDLLRDFTLTIGVVSNHGNWFTSEDHNKELKVLAQSYDWLVFLTDQGLSAFVESLLIKPTSRYEAIRHAFESSYTGTKGKNTFTKVQIDLAADTALRDFFSANVKAIERWFNVIAPAGRSLRELRRELSLLASKDWEGILA